MNWAENVIKKKLSVQNEMMGLEVAENNQLSASKLFNGSI